MADQYACTLAPFLRITGNGLWDGMPAVDCTRCEEHRSVVSILCERLESKSREVVEMLQERERGEHALLQARKELRQSRLRLMQVMQDLDKVTDKAFSIVYAFHLCVCAIVRVCLVCMSRPCA